MNLKIEPNYEKADAVHFDAGTRQIVATFSGVARAIPIDAIPERDWDSTASIAGFYIGHEGASIICRHSDGEETPFPADMWEPGGFTPDAAKVRGPKNKARAGSFANRLRESRIDSGMSQNDAADMFNMPLRTFQEWEQGRSEPPVMQRRHVLGAFARNKIGHLFGARPKKRRPKTAKAAK